MALFPATAFFVFLFLFFQNKNIWKSLALAVLIAIVLNAPQIIHEVRYDYSNTHTFIKDMTGSNRIDNSKKVDLSTNLERSLDCHAEANAFMVSSAGDNVCGFSYVGLFHSRNPAYINLLTGSDPSIFLAQLRTANFWIILIGGLFFSILGYGLFTRRCFKEQDEGKKCFLYLIALYLILSFFIMTSVIGGGFTEFRYFIHTFFVPFLFLGLIAEYLIGIKKFRPVWIIVCVLLFLGVAVFNVKAIASRYEALAAKDGSNEHFVILGEVEPMVSYLINNSAGSKEVQLDGNPRYLSNFFNALNYLAGNQNFKLIRVTHPNKITAGKTLFYITINGNNPLDMKEDGHKIGSRRDFGQVTIYQLVNP